MSSPLLWGPNNTSNNLQSQALLANGQLLAWNGPKNYIGNSSLEAQVTTGWTLFNTTLTGGLPTGSVSAGAASLALSVTTTNPLAGLASLQVVAASAWAAGAGIISSTFTIDRENQAQVLPGGFKYEPISGTSNANWSGTLGSQTFIIAIRDITNSTWVNGGAIPGYNSMKTGVGPGPSSFQFQTNALGAGNQYAIAILASQASAGAITLNFDDIFVGPQAASSSSAAVVFQGTQSSQAVTANVTDLTLAVVKDSSGSWNGTQFKAPASGSYILHGSVQSSGGTTIRGYINGANTNVGAFATSGAGNFGGGAIPFYNVNAGDLISIRSDGSVTLTNGNFGIFQIGGGGVGPAGQVVAASYFLSANFTASTTVPINWDTKIFDTTASVTTSATAWKFTAPVSGIYTVGGTASQTAGANVGMQLYKNGSAFQGIGIMNTSFGQLTFSVDVQLNAGDFIDIRPTTGNTYAGNTLATQNTGYITIVLNQGPSSQQANPTVAASYWMSSNKSVTANVTPLNFDSKDFDTTANVTTGASWQFLTQTSGVYQVSFLVTETVNSNFSIIIFKNGSALKAIGERLTNGPAQGTAIVNLNAGDIIYLVSDTNQTFSGNASQATGGTSYICINKVG